jgi:glyoxylase-like metal-dependent hydrolase (beta-lactamase superfamily II)
MREVAEGIHRLTNGVANFHLIEESGKLVLVDAGAPRDWDLLGQVVRELGRDLGDLDAVLLTHAHTDHTGFAERARLIARPGPGALSQIPRQSRDIGCQWYGQTRTKCAQAVLSHIS